MNRRERTSNAGVKDREMLYRLIVSQLRYDGYENAAASFSNIISAFPPTAPSSRLSLLVQLGLRAEGEGPGNPETADVFPPTKGQGVLDLEFESDEVITAPPVNKHEVTYITSHKGPVLTATFSRDGRLAATGSADCTIKVLDVEAMMTKPALGHHHEAHPVLRTLYDHNEAVSSVDFHPTVSVLASGSKDCTVKFFDYSKPAVKRCYRAIQEVAPARCVMFHPSGDYMLVGTEHPTLRLYDVSTLQCFVASDARNQHTEAVTSVHYSVDGRFYVTGSKDGAIKIWDGVSNKCVNTLKEAHTKEPVSSVRISKNSKYVLSSGKDGNAALWEISTARPLNTFQPSKAGKVPYRPCAVFNYTEDYVIMGDEKQQQQLVLCWDSRTTQPCTPLVSGHLNTIRSVSYSPTAPAFITCATDCKVRFFFYKGSSSQ